MEDIFESWIDIFSKESERPHIESTIDVKQFLKDTER